MFQYRDCQTVNGYTSQPLSSLQADCSLISQTTTNSKLAIASRIGLMAISNGTDSHPHHPNHHTHTHHTHNHHSNHHHHHAHTHHTSTHPGTTNPHQHSPPPASVFDVWAHNFADGMRLLRHLTKLSRVVAVDTEFPGVVARVFGEYASTFEQSYHNIKVNIDILKPIQIGFSFFLEDGTHPDTISTVQFNMKWDVEMETYASDSINLLESSGIDFEKLKRNGIELQDFAECFINSGLPLNDTITWIGFHSAYDWAYILKVCTAWQGMPDMWRDFQKYLTLYFPRIVDIKTLMNEYKLHKGGLQELADLLQVKRVGSQHQAGSDAKLTGETYFRFLQEYADGKLDSRQVNFVYGLNYCPNGAAAANLWTPINAPSPIHDSENGAGGVGQAGSSMSQAGTTMVNGNASGAGNGGSHSSSGRNSPGGYSDNSSS